MPSGFLCVRPSALNDGKLLEDIYNDISLLLQSGRGIKIELVLTIKQKHYL